MNHRRWLGLLLAVLLVAAPLLPPFRQTLELPQRLTVPADQMAELHIGFPVVMNVSTEQNGILAVAGRTSRQLAIRPLAPGSADVNLSLFGIIPLRTVTVDVVPPLLLVPGGHSIGILIHSKGVRVVDHAAVETVAGDRLYPGREAGLRAGDTIMQINGRPVSDVEQVGKLVQEAGVREQPLELAVQRGSRHFSTQVKPAYDRNERRFLIGVWIRDATTGVGTLTFYEPRSKTFGALGHSVVDDGQRVQVGRGRIVPSAVLDVQRAEHGRPGEKIGTFDVEAPALGTIRRNTVHGIMGQLNEQLQNPFFHQPLPAGFAAQVRGGPAEILTVVRDQEMGRYQIMIERILGLHNDGKNMIVRITDDELLRATGGIVQGMSGTPIIQDGRLVGAITHVFINDPTRGYAVFIESMLKEAGLLPVGEQLPGAG